jgi:hypothetical protein
MLSAEQIATLLIQLGDPERAIDVLHELTEDCKMVSFPHRFRHEVASLFDCYAISPPDENFLSALTNFLSEVVRSSYYVKFFVRKHVFQRMWGCFPHYGTLDFFRRLLDRNEMNPDLYCRTNQPFDRDQELYDQACLENGYRVVAHFCTENGVAQRIIDYWDEFMASAMVELLRFLYCFAELSFAFAPFEPVRERLLPLAFQSEDLVARRYAIRLVGLFGSQCVAGMHWLLQQEKFLDYFRTVPDDIELAKTLLTVLGGESRWRRVFRLFGLIREMEQQDIELFLGFTLAFIPFEVDELQRCAVAALADSVLSFDIASYLLDRQIHKVLIEMFDSDCSFQTKESAMQCLCEIFTILPPELAVQFADDGFFTCLFEWFEPMFLDIPGYLTDAIRAAFEIAESNPSMAAWIDLTVENDEINSLLVNFACDPVDAARYGIDSDELNARGLLTQFEGWKTFQE